MVAADTIDVRTLPKRAAIDASVAIPAWGGKPRKTDDPMCAPFIEAMLAAGNTILIPAPAAAEFFRRSPSAALPRTPQIEVSVFDRRAAEELGAKFPPDVLIALRDAPTKKGPKPTLYYIKYDAMIVACAVRHLADVFVSVDARQSELARKVGLPVRSPSDYTAAQRILTR